MKGSEQGRIREAAPSARRGEGPRSSISLPSSFKCPLAICCAPIIRPGADGVAGRLFYPPECAVGAPHAPWSALRAVCFCLGWDCQGPEGWRVGREIRMVYWQKLA
jgi:hypothetical protein